MSECVGERLRCTIRDVREAFDERIDLLEAAMDGLRAIEKGAPVPFTADEFGRSIEDPGGLLQPEAWAKLFGWAYDAQSEGRRVLQMLRQTRELL